MKDRTADRQPRGKRQHKRCVGMEYYLIVTDTDATEKCYFDGFFASLPDGARQRINHKVVKCGTSDLVQMCRRLTDYDPQYRIPWIVFDRDEVPNFDEIIHKAEQEGIHVGWSNPCFEIWLHAYFGRMPGDQTSQSCCARFARKYEEKTGLEYSKTDKVLYQHLCRCGDEAKAIQTARNRLQQFQREGVGKPVLMCPSTTVYQLIEEIRNKVGYCQ